MVGLTRGFADYARSLAANVFHATGVPRSDIALALDVEAIVLGVGRAIPCGLIINELITNSLKHAFKTGGGTIRVALKSTAPGWLRLTVADDGAGLPQSLDIATTRSMGLQLVVTLAEQLAAELVVTRVGGTTFSLTFARAP